MIVSLVFLVSAVVPPARIEALVERTPMQLPAQGRNTVDNSIQCTADKRWCVQLLWVDQGATKLSVFDGTRKERDQDWSYSIAPDAPGWRDASLRLWPQIVREAVVQDGREPRETIGVGVIAVMSTMYSGGGGQAERLTLYRL